MDDHTGSRLPAARPTHILSKRRRVMLGVAIIVASWYAFIGLFICDIGSASPVLSMLAREALRAHAQDVCERRRAFGDILDSPLLEQITRRRPPSGNFYWVRGLSRVDGTPVAVIAFPDRSRIPQASLIFRLLFLDRRKLHYSSYLLTSEGAMWRNSDMKFEPGRLPSVEMLGMLETSVEWTKEQTLPMSEPCGHQ